MGRFKKIILSFILVFACLFPVACAESENYSYTVAITTEGNGTCRSTMETVQFGDTVEFSIKPDNYYQIKEFSINGTVIPITGTTHVEYCVTQDLSVKVVFEYAYIKVSYNADTINYKLPDRYSTKNGYYGWMPKLKKISEEPVGGDSDVNNYYCLQDNQVFVGWYTEPNGQGKHIMGACIAPENDHTLYAYIKTVE